MTIALNNRSRGIVGVRAESADATKIFTELRGAVEALKEAHETELKGINAKDVVQTEKVDRINTEVSALQTSLDEVNGAIAALKVGGGSGSDIDPDKAEYSKAFNTWFRKGDRAIADADLGDMAVKAALSTDSNPDGGYVVTPEMDTAIERVLGTVSSMRGLANVRSVGTDEYKKLVNMGGAGSGWVGEKEARPETSTPTLRELIFNTMEIYANPAITQRSLDDSYLDIAAWLADEVSTEFAEKEGEAFINGDGVNKPRGILSYTTVANASYAWGKIGFTKTGAAAAFNATDPADALIDLYYSLKSGYRNGATFLTSDAVMKDIRKMKDGQDNYLWAPPASAEMPSTILGKPVETDDNMDALGANKFPVAFGNFNRGYLIIDRIGTRVLRDPYTNKPYVHFYTTKRVGGGVQNFEAIKLLKCAE